MRFVEVGKLAREGRFDYLLVESTGILEPLPAAEPRLGRRTVRTFPLLPPPQKNRSPPSDSSPDTPTPGGISSLSRTSPVRVTGGQVSTCHIEGQVSTHSPHRIRSKPSLSGEDRLEAALD